MTMNKESLREAIKDLVLDALFTDGAHHKQWYLEKILETMDYDVKKLKEDLSDRGYEWDDGIAP